MWRHSRRGCCRRYHQECPGALPCNQFALLKVRFPKSGLTVYARLILGCGRCGNIKEWSCSFASHLWPGPCVAGPQGATVSHASDTHAQPEQLVSGTSLLAVDSQFSDAHQDGIPACVWYSSAPIEATRLRPQFFFLLHQCFPKRVETATRDVAAGAHRKLCCVTCSSLCPFSVDQSRPAAIRS